MNLRNLYEKLDKSEREAFATRVGIQPAYLWQLATQWRGKQPSLDLLSKLADADRRLSVAELVQEFTEDAPAAAPKPPPRRRASDMQPESEKAQREPG